MCGIIGAFWNQAHRGIKNKLQKAIKELKNRGPDDEGIYIDSIQQSTVALAHTRLSIIDLSSHGRQPMTSQDGRYSLIFNGEIYNYRELRKELQAKGCNFISNSDTEVLLNAWRIWGSSCLQRLIGMFAFVIYDKAFLTLTCVRDAFGIKPFFYSNQKDNFLFSSEISALLTLFDKKPEVDWQRSYDYLVQGDYDSQERTFIDGVKHLMPAHMMVFDVKTGQLGDPECWWNPYNIPESDLTYSQAVEAVRHQFLENIRLHLRSDVPLGMALSGGIDSSAVVCAARHLEPDIPIHNFSYIARGSKASEEHWVDKINNGITSNVHKVITSGDGLINDLDALIQAQGEPFGSTSIYAQYCVFKKAKQDNITVMLDGQGADELMAGYIGYPGHRLLSLLETGQFFRAMSFAKQWSQWPGRSYNQAWKYLFALILSDRFYHLARQFIGKESKPEWMEPDILREKAVNILPSRVRALQKSKGRRVIAELQRSLQGRGLVSLLRHADRNSMHFSIESRVPFLTVPMANLLFSLPEQYLIANNGETKHVFRSAMRGIVPDEILDRRDKIGFETPEKAWLFEMAPTVRNWLKASETIPFLNTKALLEAFDAVIAQKKPFSWQVWRWINYVRWYEQMGFID